mmetsp:Transcript_40845/g.81919  ORF Transcript_40845/g.81919 Transcript_40845/m.81919 type:complete len:282 (+) Transcript_40845:290-1135(+)
MALDLPCSCHPLRHRTRRLACPAPRVSAARAPTKVAQAASTRREPRIFNEPPRLSLLRPTRSCELCRSDDVDSLILLHPSGVLLCAGLGLRSTLLLHVYRQLMRLRPHPVHPQPIRGSLAICDGARHQRSRRCSACLSFVHQPLRDPFSQLTSCLAGCHLPLRIRPIYSHGAGSGAITRAIPDEGCCGCRADGSHPHRFRHPYQYDSWGHHLRRYPKGDGAGYLWVRHVWPHPAPRLAPPSLSPEGRQNVRHVRSCFVGGCEGAFKRGPRGPTGGACGARG